MSKTIIRNNTPPQMAEQMCNAIDAHEKAEHFQRFIREWIEYQQKQQIFSSSPMSKRDSVAIKYLFLFC